MDPSRIVPGRVGPKASRLGLSQASLLTRGERGMRNYATHPVTKSSKMSNFEQPTMDLGANHVPSTYRFNCCLSRQKLEVSEDHLKAFDDIFSSETSF
ncbi:hypothetical protein TNCV_1191591 [Trichonephila clavipes]|nr:hypothetical protein TNCV_1191591 [Trichonephila clavipes]